MIITPIELRVRARLIEKEPPGRTVTARFLRRAADQIEALCEELAKLKGEQTDVRDK